MGELGKKVSGHIQTAIRIGQKLHSVVKTLLGHKKTYQKKAESPRAISSTGDTKPSKPIEKSKVKAPKQEEYAPSIPKASKPRQIGQGIRAVKKARPVAEKILTDTTRSPQDKIKAAKREAKNLKTQAEAPSLKQIKKISKEGKKKQEALVKDFRPPTKKEMKAARKSQRKLVKKSLSKKR